MFFFVFFFLLPASTHGHTHSEVALQSQLGGASFFFLFFLAVLLGMWNLSSLTRDQTCAPALEVRSLNHCTAREVPCVSVLCLTQCIGETFP